MTYLRAILSIAILNLGMLIPIKLGCVNYFNKMSFWILYFPYLLISILYSFISERLVLMKIEKRQKKALDILFELYSMEIKKEADDDSIVVVLFESPSWCFAPLLGKGRFFNRCFYRQYPLDLDNILGFKLIQSAKAGIEAYSYKKRDTYYIDYNDVINKKNYPFGTNDISLIMVHHNSAIACPVISIEEDHPIKGILAVYSKKELSKTKFTDDKFQNYLNKIANQISLSICSFSL